MCSAFAQNQGGEFISSGKILMKQNNSYCCVVGEAELANMANINVFERVVQGDVSALDYLSRNSPTHLSTRDENGAGPIHYAAASGHLDIIRLIVANTGLEELDVQDADGQTPLHFAVEKNQESSCSLLLDLGANPNTVNKAMMAPIHLAITKEHNYLVKVLLSCSRIDVNLEGDLGNTPVMLACSHNNCEALHTLFKYGVKLCHQNKLGHYAIHTVAFSGAKEAMEVLLQKGEELGISTQTHINYLDKSKSSPLHLAVGGGNTEVIKLCISKGAKVDQQQCDKSTALHFACTQGALEAVEAMLVPYERRIDEIINIRDAANQTPLHKATLFDHVELAKYLVSKGADIDSVDCKGLTPLLLATTNSAWKTVSFLLSKGANFRIKDKAGRNFFHLVMFQPKGLKNIPEHLLQNKEVWEMMSDEDFEGCTPLHYACKLGIHDSVKNMLGFEISLGRKSREKKSPLHFAAEYGRINTCLRLLDTITDSRLLNEGDENGLTPLHLASRGGHIKVVDLLLRRGALFHSDYKGWTCLHHAAAEGYTQTMTTLLAANIKVLDNTDEDGNTALHLAAREGHVAAVNLLLNQGAEILLNNNYASFFHDAVRNGKKDVANAAIDNERSAEIIRQFRMGYSRCSVLDLIEFLPESAKHLLDHCMTESEHDPNSTDYHITYNFQWLQAPVNVQKASTMDESLYIQPLASLNAMVQYNRIELLNHPVCQKYLEMKWKAYGSKAHLLNLAVYLLGLLPLTYLVINLNPSQNSTTTGNFTREFISFQNQNYLISISMLMVFIMNVYAVCKEVIQIAQQRINYFYDSSNLSDWATAIASLAFVTPMFFGVKGNLHWQAGALAILFAWMNFLLYLQRFENCGIYVVMFGEIIKTLLKVLVLFMFLLLAFGLSFHALMHHRVEFNSVALSLAQTFVMTVGELNYETSFLEAYTKEHLTFPSVTYFVFVSFVLLMPILLMNLMIGLAVGDIAEVQRNASLKRIAMQINLHTNLEEKLPYWFMNRVDKDSVTIYPNKKCANFLRMLEIFGTGHREEVRIRLNTQGTPYRSQSQMETEMMKQKYKLKQISSALEKQGMLLKLIIQKMEITTEADENDGPDDFRAITTAKLQKSRWVPLMQAFGVKKSHSTS